MPDLSAYSETELNAMRAAAADVVEINQSLAAQGSSIVEEVLRTRDSFVEWDHYPKGDVHDEANHSRYYYHCHDGHGVHHGHFHTFYQYKGVPANVRPSAAFAGAQRPKDDVDPVIHLVGIALNHRGEPIALFTVNRWVSDEIFYAAADVQKFVRKFSIQKDGALSSVNRWMSAFLTFFRPQIDTLLAERDRVLIEHQAQLESGACALEDRDIDCPSMCPISILDQLDALQMLED